jgi:hypothetical protein
MNERIKELAEQAGVFAGDFAGAGLYSIHNKEEVEKFAELIVKETMQVVANQLPSNQYLDVAHAVIEHYKDADVT